MIKPRTIIPVAKLRKRNSLKAVVENVTRWGSKHSMLERYMQLRPHLPNFDDEDVEALIPATRVFRQLESLLPTLQSIESVSKRLQQDDMTIREVRALID